MTHREKKTGSFENSENCCFCLIFALLIFSFFFVFFANALQKMENKLIFQTGVYNLSLLTLTQTPSNSPSVHPTTLSPSTNVPTSVAIAQHGAINMCEIEKASYTFGAWHAQYKPRSRCFLTCTDMTNCPHQNVKCDLIPQDSPDLLNPLKIARCLKKCLYELLTSVFSCVFCINTHF